MPLPFTEALRVCLELARLFERLDVPYVLGGSLASSLHGVPRSTEDADLAADLRPQHVPPFVAALQDRFYVAEERVRQAVESHTSFNVIELATMFKVDVFVLGAGPMDEEELARRERFRLPDSGEEISVASAEDTVLRKLHWYQRGGGVSDRQWRDLLGILEIQGTRLDGSYLRRGAATLGVEELLEKALGEAAAGG